MLEVPAFSFAIPSYPSAFDCVIVSFLGRTLSVLRFWPVFGNISLRLVLHYMVLAGLLR
jgi:hypothetical protein